MAKRLSLQYFLLPLPPVSYQQFAPAQRDPGCAQVMSSSGITLGIVHNICLELRCSDGRYQVVGPSPVLQLLDGAPLLGSVSPHADITLGREVWETVGIPPSAHTYAFAYPLRLEAHAWARIEERLSRVGEELSAFLYFGGFLYFNRHSQLLQVNAVTPKQSPHVVFLAGPFAAAPGVLEWMAQEQRMCPVTVESLTKAGFSSFGWVHGHEAPAEEPMGPHGSFLYEMTDSRPVFYALTDDESWTAPNAVLTQSRKRIESLDFIASAHSGLRNMFQRFATSARHLRHERLRNTRMAEANLRRSEKQARVTAIRTVVTFLSFVLIGSVIFYAIESQGCKSGESDRICNYWNAAYFCVVTMSTVGYGDGKSSRTN